MNEGNEGSVNEEWKHRVEEADRLPVSTLVKKLKTLDPMNYTGWKLSTTDTHYMVEVFFKNGSTISLDDFDRVLDFMLTRVQTRQITLCPSNASVYPNHLGVGVSFERSSEITKSMERRSVVLTGHHNGPWGRKNARVSVSARQVSRHNRRHNPLLK